MGGPSGPMQSVALSVVVFWASASEILDADTMEVLANKVIPKSLLPKLYLKESMSMEMSIHCGLAHHHIADFHSRFEDCGS